MTKIKLPKFASGISYEQFHLVCGENAKLRKHNDSLRKQLRKLKDASKIIDSLNVVLCSGPHARLIHLQLKILRGLIKKIK